MWYSRYFFVNLPSDSCSENELIVKYLAIRELSTVNELRRWRHYCKISMGRKDLKSEI